MKIKKLIKLIHCFYTPVLVFLLHFMFVQLHLYSAFAWADMPMHFLGGMSIAYSCILVLRKVKEEVVIHDRFFEILIIVALVGLSAILWELSELVVENLFNLNWQLTLIDTLCDLFLGLVGGLTISSLIKVKGGQK